jgi:RNA polymerase sigma factor (TIGR02999 family)
MNDVTRILSAIDQGQPHSTEELLPLVYSELRKLAAHKLAKEKPGQTIDATALVHEVYLRLVDGDKTFHWNSRGHFFGAAAEAMRRILVERARQRRAQKRGGHSSRVQLEESALLAPEPAEDMIALSDALDALSATDPGAANLIKLRFFAGLTMNEAAQSLGISVRTAQGMWAYARSWLHRKMRES